VVKRLVVIYYVLFCPLVLSLSRGRQIRRFLADEIARRNFQPVPTFSVGISLSDWLGVPTGCARFLFNRNSPYLPLPFFKTQNKNDVRRIMTDATLVLFLSPRVRLVPTV
jgi:hypothetical protein